MQTGEKVKGRGSTDMKRRKTEISGKGYNEAKEKGRGRNRENAKREKSEIVKEEGER